MTARLSEDEPIGKAARQEGARRLVLPGVLRVGMTER